MHLTVCIELYIHNIADLLFQHTKLDYAYVKWIIYTVNCSCFFFMKADFHIVKEY